MKEQYYKQLSVVFLIFIIGLGILLLYLPKQKEDLNENRALSELPKINLNRLDDFPPQFNQYVNDHFPYRNNIVQYLNYYNYKHFNKSAITNKVIIGDNDFMFMRGINSDVHLAKKLFTNQELQQIEKELLSRKHFCEKNNARFYFVIIPQKHSIYNEYLPYVYQRKTSYNIKKQLIDFLSQKDSIQVIDVEPYMLKHKQEGLFYKYDNHWNETGALYGLKSILAELKKDFEILDTTILDHYNDSVKLKNNGNLAGMLGLNSLLVENEICYYPDFTAKAIELEKGYDVPEGFPYPWDFEHRFRNDAAPDLKFMMVRESFGGAELKFIQESFRNTVSIFDGWEYNFHKDIFLNEKPDIYVLQIYEPLLVNLVREYDTL